MPKKKNTLSGELNITRRDFVNASLCGAGAALLTMRAPAFAGQGKTEIIRQGLDAAWYGYGGVGDYASSHGNTPEVANTAHNLRDGMYDDESDIEIIDLDETYDLIIVGGGMAGLGAAYEHTKIANPGEKCLMIENHPVFGGESKRNEFNVGGHLLIGPQGANGFSAPSNEDALRFPDVTADVRYMVELGISTDFTYAELQNTDKNIRLAKDSYGFQYWQEDITSVGYYLGKNEAGKSKWSFDPIDHAGPYFVFKFTEDHFRLGLFDEDPAVAARNRRKPRNKSNRNTLQCTARSKRLDSSARMRHVQ